MTEFSILELVRVTEDTDPGTALNNARDMAAHAERWGFKRVWVAEHHNMEGIASAATSIVIGHIAGGTKTIRVGAGGIMLPNHAPYIIAEQFGTLEHLYPGRIDLGLGRAPGTDQIAVRPMPRIIFHKTFRNSRHSWGRAHRSSVFLRYRARAPMCPCGYWAPATSAPLWRPSWVCLTPSLRTLHRTC